MTESGPVEMTKQLAEQADQVTIEDKLEWSYNPLKYAWPVHKQWLEKWGSEPKQALFLGMNPGPWGMGQTGVPFGDPYIVGDDMGLRGTPIRSPENERDDRPVLGWDSTREEGSGQRLFGYIKNHWSSLHDFLKQNFILNYWPLLMFNQEGKNLTPSKLLKSDRTAIFETVDPLLERFIEFYDPRVLVGIGKFAHERLIAVGPGNDCEIARIPHPSPASPIATRDGGQYWIDLVTDTLAEHGLLSVE